jgi:hypothetical protein
MARRLCVPEELRETVATFLETSGLDLEIAESEPCDIRVETGGERRESTADTLEAGGWIGCATVWAMAAKHELALRRLGALLNVLDIKVRNCSLGCFE